jgi:hypothetical protein
MSLQIRQAGITCERIEIRQGTRPQFPGKLEISCVKSEKNVAKSGNEHITNSVSQMRFLLNPKRLFAFLKLFH